MGFLVNEKQFVNDAIFKHEERMESQFNRFIDKQPTFVTYYSISNNMSTADNGFINIERSLGPDSPLRFNEIKEFPVYGLESIQLDLNDEDEGLNTSYDSELIVLPNTIQPKPNDYFIIPYLKDHYVFMVTGVKYDTIKSNNFYKLSFTLKSISEDSVNNLVKQTDEKYNCIYTNIGTQDKCLIREDEYEKFILLDKFYNQLADDYKMLFYNERYNAFLFIDDEEHRIHNNYLVNFINKNKLFCKPYDYSSIVLELEATDSRFYSFYERSMYREFEKNNRTNIRVPNYQKMYITNRESVFVRYNDRKIRNIMLSPKGIPLFSREINEAINNKVYTGDNLFISLLVDYINDSVKSVYNIDFVKLSEFNYMDYNHDNFNLIPIILYIIKHYYKTFVSNK